MRNIILTLFSILIFTISLSGCLSATARVKKTPVASISLPGMEGLKPAQVQAAEPKTRNTSADSLSNEELDAAITAERDANSVPLKIEESARPQEPAVFVTKQAPAIAPKMIDLSPAVSANPPMLNNTGISRANIPEENISKPVPETQLIPVVESKFNLAEQPAVPSAILQKTEPKTKGKINKKKKIKSELAVEAAPEQQAETPPARIQPVEPEEALPAKEAEIMPEPVVGSLPVQPKEMDTVKEPEPSQELPALSVIEPAPQAQVEPADKTEPAAVIKETLPVKESTVAPAPVSQAPVEPAAHTLVEQAPQAQPEQAAKPKPVECEPAKPALSPAPVPSHTAVSSNNEAGENPPSVSKEASAEQSKAQKLLEAKKRLIGKHSPDTGKIAKKEEFIKQKKSAGETALTAGHEAKMHTVARGDNLQTLAERYYQDKSMWLKIYDANKDKIDKGSLVTGQVIIIP